MKNKLQIILRLSVLSLAMGCYAHFAFPQALVSLHEPSDDDFLARTTEPRKENQNKTLKSVLEELQAKYNIYFTYDTEVIQDKIVSDQNNKTETQPLEKVLAAYLTPLNLSYKKIRDNYYVIYKKESTGKLNKLNSVQPNLTQPLKAKGLSVTKFEATLRNFDKTISGTVTDESDGSGLPGVNIIA